MEDQNPLGTLPGSEQPNLPAISPSSPPPRLAQPQPQADPQQMAQMADTVHHAGIGKAFRSLMGNEVNYSIGADGKLVQSETPRSGSNLWRSMLAGVLLGGATASKEGAKSFAGGAAEGGAAVIQHGEQQDAQKRAQAGQDFKTQMEAQANQRANKGEERADRSAETETKLKLVQIAVHNAQTLRENGLIRDQDLAYHEKVAEHGRSQLDPYIKAGIPYFQKDVLEHDMLGLDPGALGEHAKYLWEPTGTRVMQGSDGKPTHVATYSAVDPKGDISVTAENLKYWGKDAAALDSQYGQNFFEVLKPGSKLDAKQYMAITQLEQTRMNDKYEKERKDLDLQKESTSIDLAKANITHLKAESAKLFTEANEKKLSDSAFVDLQKNGGNLSKLNAKQLSALSKGANENMKTIEERLYRLPKDANGGYVDQGLASKLAKDWEDFGNIAKKVYGIKPEVASAAKPAGEKSTPVQNLIQKMQEDDKIKKGTEEAYNYIYDPSRKMSDQDRLEAAKAVGAIVPYDIVEAMAKTQGVPIKKMIETFKTEGLKIGKDYSDTNPLSVN